RDAAEHGWPAMHARLASVDPDAAARIAPNDKQRIQRALEVFLCSGVPLTRLQREAARGQGDTPHGDIPMLAVVPADRGPLAARIERRFDAMVEAGLVGEVESLISRGDLDANMPS